MNMAMIVDEIEEEEEGRRKKRKEEEDEGTRKPTTHEADATPTCLPDEAITMSTSVRNDERHKYCPSAQADSNTLKWYVSPASKFSLDVFNLVVLCELKTATHRYSESLTFSDFVWFVILGNS